MRKRETKRKREKTRQQKRQRAKVMYREKRKIDEIDGGRKRESVKEKA